MRNSSGVSLSNSKRNSLSSILSVSNCSGFNEHIHTVTHNSSFICLWSDQPEQKQPSKGTFDAVGPTQCYTSMLHRARHDYCSFVENSPFLMAIFRAALQICPQACWWVSSNKEAAIDHVLYLLILIGGARKQGSRTRIKNKGMPC